MVADPITSGIFGYINYLVDKDRKYILDTLVNGTCSQGPVCLHTELLLTRSWIRPIATRIQRV